jgi:hypothetical protein
MFLLRINRTGTTWSFCHPIHADLQFIFALPNHAALFLVSSTET